MALAGYEAWPHAESRLHVRSANAYYSAPARAGARPHLKGQGSANTMLIRVFWAYMLGFLVLAVRGEHPERFINLATRRGVALWDVNRVNPETILVKAPARSFVALRHIARRTNVRVRIRARGGLPFILQRLRRRWMLVGGAITFCLLLYLLSSLIWTVDVVGTRQLDPAQVRRAAASAGLYPGNLRFLVNGKDVADRLMREMPGIAFAEVDFRGTQVSIRICERVVPQPSLGAANIVAVKDGVIKDMLVLAGSPQVKEGDVVRAGQILISGIIAPPPPPKTEGAPQPPAPKYEPRYVEAQGIVRARVWYRCYAEAPREELVEQKTGRVTSIVSIRLANKEIIIKGPPAIPYLLYDLTENKRKLPQWRNITLPVEFVTIRAEEIRRFLLRRSYDEALRLAVQRAQAILADQLPAGAVVTARQSKVVNADMDHVGVLLTVETLEEIGLPQQFAPPNRKSDAGGRKSE
jgi:similar to stage IV sporulation protein